jgi:hypothetical protein
MPDQVRHDMGLLKSGMTLSYGYRIKSGMTFDYSSPAWRWFVQVRDDVDLFKHGMTSSDGYVTPGLTRGPSRHRALTLIKSSAASPINEFVPYHRRLPNPG